MKQTTMLAGCAACGGTPEVVVETGSVVVEAGQPGEEFFVVPHHTTRTGKHGEIGDGIYRISTPVPPNPALPSGFTFNQFLIVDNEPLVFHTGLRGLLPLVREAIEAAEDLERLERWTSRGGPYYWPVDLW